MADTERTITACLTLLADNTTGDISAQDVRDTVVSLVSHKAEIYVATPAATTVSAVSTWYKMAGATSSGVISGHYTHPSDGRVTHTGTVTRTNLIQAVVSFTCASANQDVWISVYKSGTIVDSSIQKHKVGASGDISSTYIQCLVSLAENDYVEVYVLNDTSAANVTAVAMNLIAIEAPTT